jgi:cytochrome c556
MKKSVALLTFAILAAAVFAYAAGESKPELRPTQVVMQARAAWMKAMNENLGTKMFEAIVKDADGLAAQTKKIGDGHPNPLAKELTLAVSSLAKEVSAAAAKKDGDAVKAKLGAIKDKCGECHAKIRDKDKKK